MTTEKKTQTRGICPHCGHEQAVLKNGRMSKHGYSVNFGWFDGVCSGQNHKPLQLDRAPTDQLIADIAARVAETKALNDALRTGTKHPAEINRGTRHRPEIVQWADATAYERERATNDAISANDYTIRQMEAFNAYMELTIERFYGQELKVVELDPPAVPVRVGDKKKSPNPKMTDIECARVERGRVYYQYTRAHDQKRITTWTGLASWRKLEDA